jgi:3'-phosphoadenosine 5'-phosphosulfate sulfotransferase (PAPS reductase)/FAD synthetase
MRAIVAISGGKASAWCVGWAFRNYKKKDIILYFNDTKWEHPDLYRFLHDISRHYNHNICFDSDGRSPEELFLDNNALANNRMPFCSRILKAERLQKFYRDGDHIIFGIDNDEQHRAIRICSVYQLLAARKGKFAKLIFPLINENVTKDQINAYLADIGVPEPALYKLGFTHNNCSGGCVRAGKKQWKLLLEVLPDVYAERERVEERLRKVTGKDIHYFKDETLTNFRRRVESGDLSKYYDSSNIEKEVECVGVCATMA